MIVCKCGVAGGLLGGMLFDPIHYLLSGGNIFASGAELSRCVGFVTIGASTTHPFMKHCGDSADIDGQDGTTSEVTFTFTTPGYYNYRCEAHESMRGNIQVVP